VNDAIAGLQDPSQKSRELWGCLQEPNADGGLYTCNVTPIFDNNTAARWIHVAMKLSNPMLFCVVYRGQQTDSTAGAQTPMCGGHSYLPLDDIIPPPAKDMIDDIREESDDDGETWRPNPRSFLTTKTGFQKFEQKLQKMITRLLRYVEVIRNRAPGLFAHYKESVVADDDVALLHEHDHIMNPLAVGSLANTKCSSSRPATN